MIARIWRGAVRTGDADEYAAYIRDTGFAEYGRTDGNHGAWMLRRDDGGETEFITLSMWESRDAIKAFAGEDIEAAVLSRRTRSTSSGRARSPTTTSSTRSKPAPVRRRAARAATRSRGCRARGR